MNFESREALVKMGVKVPSIARWEFSSTCEKLEIIEVHATLENIRSNDDYVRILDVLNSLLIQARHCGDYQNLETLWRKLLHLRIPLPCQVGRDDD